MEASDSSRWRLPLELFGAAAGLAALIYTTGAATLWLRYETTYFPADLALSVTSRERIVALGFRMLVTWALVVGATIFVVSWLSRQAWVRSAASSVRSYVSRLPGRDRGRALWIIVALLAIIGSALVTWSLLTTVLVTIAAVVFFRKYGFDREGFRDPSVDRSDRRQWWRIGVFIAGAAAVLGIGWQLQVNLSYDHARLHFKRPQGAWPRVTDAIYFGQTNGTYYVAPRLEPGGPFKRSLVAVSPDELRRFQLLPYDQTLCSGVPRPIVSAGRAIEDLRDTIIEHLSRTGQPVSPPDRPPKFTGHGDCPEP